MHMPRRISLFQYSFIALPLAFAGLPIYIHAPDFYTRDIGLNIGLIGFILLAIRLLDAVQDPFIGYVSDKYNTHRFGIILTGACFLVMGMGTLFHGPQLMIPASVWFTLSMILATTGFSIVSINLSMIGGFWSSEPDQRTRISAWRESFALIGLLIASVLPAALQTNKPSEQAFQIVFWVFLMVMIPAFLLFTRFMKHIANNVSITPKTTIKDLSLFSLLFGADRHFFAVCFLTHLAASIPAVLVLFFIHDYLGAQNLSGLFLALYFISGAMFINIWVQLAARFGKYHTWLMAMLLSVVVFIWAFFIKPGDTVFYGIICILSGIALGADLALPPSILADRVTKQNKEAKATQFFALLAFIPKIALAFASAFAFLILDHLGFEAGKNNSIDVMQGIIILYALVPCLVKLCAAYYLWRLCKKEGDHNDKNERIGFHGTYDIS